MEIPDARDGLVKLQRQILIFMAQNEASAPINGSEIVSTIEQSIKITKDNVDEVPKNLLRLVLPEANRYPLLNGEGLTGDLGDLLFAEQIADKFNESRISFSTFGREIFDELIHRLKTGPDISYEQPFPAKLPHYLLNGFEGTHFNMPPHNLNELIDGICACIDDPMLNTENLLSYVIGPDFSGGGSVFNSDKIRTAYTEGHAELIVRADILQTYDDLKQSEKGCTKIVAKFLPHLDDAASAADRIAVAIQNEQITGILDMEWTKTDITIELKSDADPNMVIQQLYDSEVLQAKVRVDLTAFSTDSINGYEAVSLVQLINAFVKHRILTLQTQSIKSLDSIRAELRDDLLRLKLTFNDDPRRTLVQNSGP